MPSWACCRDWEEDGDGVVVVGVRRVGGVIQIVVLLLQRSLTGQQREAPSVLDCLHTVQLRSKGTRN